MSLIPGPFEFKVGLDVITDIESIDFAYTVDSTDYDTVQGKKRTAFGTHKVEVTITLLDNDIPALAVALPQYFVANGGVLSTGETVNNADGAIDLVPGGCDVGAVTNDLVITSCGNPGQVLRIPDALAQIDGIEFDGGNARKVLVKFIGQSDAATVQFFKEGAVSIMS
jgi:hypothetical protein